MQRRLRGRSLRKAPAVQSAEYLQKRRTMRRSQGYLRQPGDEDVPVCFSFLDSRTRIYVSIRGLVGPSVLPSCYFFFLDCWYSFIMNMDISSVRKCY